MICRLMKTAMKNKNKAYKGACCISLSPAALKRIFEYNWTSGNTGGSLKSCLKAV